MNCLNAYYIMIVILKRYFLNRNFSPFEIGFNWKIIVQEMDGHVRCSCVIKVFVHHIFCGFAHTLYGNVLNFCFDKYLFLITIDVLVKM